ncbi:MAG: peptide deformylase [Merismopedia sp. SIO2A8]|nr:peptide deformylase [Merismopedia sp. SIO2A8]
MTSLRHIAQLGNPVLRQVAEPIYSVQDGWVQDLIDDLLVTLHRSNGVGIAAPQVSVSRRLVIVASHPNERYPDAPQMEPTPMINPQVLHRSGQTIKEWEGCLSVPGIRGLVPRSKSIEVAYTDRSGKRQKQQFSGFIARIFQHEFDHLEGKVFLDHVERSTDIITDQEYLKQFSMQLAA